jgi:hypothetical protein
VRALLAAAILAAAASLAACQIEEVAAWGTVLSVQDAQGGEHFEDLSKYDDHPLVPEVGWEIVVQLDDGAAVTVTHNGTRRYEPGERVRLLVDADEALLL